MKTEKAQPHTISCALGRRECQIEEKTVDLSQEQMEPQQNSTCGLDQ